jgi:hypothetical protein
MDLWTTEESEKNTLLPTSSNNKKIFRCADFSMASAYSESNSVFLIYHPIPWPDSISRPIYCNAEMIPLDFAATRANISVFFGGGISLVNPELSQLNIFGILTFSVVNLALACVFHRPVFNNMDCPKRVAMWIMRILLKKLSKFRSHESKFWAI